VITNISFNHQMTTTVI